MPGGDVFAQADAVDFPGTGGLCDHRQKSLHRLRGVAVAGMLFRDVVSDFPAAVADQGQLNIADVLLPGFGEHGVDQRPVRAPVPGNQEGEGLPRVFRGLENFVRHKSSVIFVEGVFMHVPGHLQREFRNDEALCFNLHAAFLP